MDEVIDTHNDDEVEIVPMQVKSSRTISARNTIRPRLLAKSFHFLAQQPHVPPSNQRLIPSPQQLLQ
jgi:hypothetical protein